MNENKKLIIIGIISALLIVGIGMFFGISYNQKIYLQGKSNPDFGSAKINKENDIEENSNKEVRRAVRIQGKVYYDTGKISTALRCGMMDGKITSNVEASQIPTQDNQSNFKGEYGFQYGLGDTIEIPINDEWHIFEAENSAEEKDKNFEIRFYDKQPYNEVKAYKILDKSEMNDCNYRVYSYEGSVNILINGEEISLRSAALENKITMDEILEKAEKDLKEGKITGDMYKDGGSKIYKYNSYVIIKLNRVDGNKDIYIGSANLNINDLGI